MAPARLLRRPALRSCALRLRASPLEGAGSLLRHLHHLTRIVPHGACSLRLAVRLQHPGLRLEEGRGGELSVSLTVLLRSGFPRDMRAAARPHSAPPRFEYAGRHGDGHAEIPGPGDRRDSFGSLRHGVGWGAPRRRRPVPRGAYPARAVLISPAASAARLLPPAAALRLRGPVSSPAASRPHDGHVHHVPRVVPRAASALRPAVRMPDPRLRLQARRHGLLIA